MKLTKRVLIDTDPGIDDCLAILFALASRTLIVEALTTTFGNAGVQRTTENLIGLLRLADIRRWPKIGKGGGIPVEDMRHRRSIACAHGYNAVGGVALPKGRAHTRIESAEALIEKSITAGGIDALITLGPLTNIAKALKRCSSRAPCLREIFIMAGTLRPVGSAAGWAETNACHDPEALAVVLRAGIPITLLSLDVTRNVLVQEDDLCFLKKARTHFSNALFKMISAYMRFHHRERGIVGASMPDPACVGLAEDGRLGRYERLRIGVDLSKKRGRLILKKTGRPNVRFCHTFDAATFKKRFITRLKGYV